MTKSKKSKILATALCTAVMAGLYAGPVMAGNATYDANSSGITINIDTERTGDGDGIFIKNGLDWNSTYKATGKITISTANLVTALNGSSFETLTIGGQAINATTIGDFKTDYSALKAKVDALDTTDLTGRVDALEKNTTGISRSGSTTMVNGNIRATANIIANQRIGVINGSQYGLIAEKDTIALGQFKINDSAETIKENAKFYVDGSTGNVMTKGDVTTEAGYSLNSVGANTAGIERYGGNNTSIEGTLKVHGGGSGSVDVYGGMIQSKNAQGGMGYMDGDKLVLTTDIHGNQTTIKGGSINTNTVYAAGDVVADGYSLAKIGENTHKISYDSVYNATRFGDNVLVNGAIVASHNSMIGGVTLSDSKIGASTASIAGIEIANGLVDGVDVSELANTGKEVADIKDNTAGITRKDNVTDIEGVAQFGNGSVKVNGTMQVAGDKFVYTYKDEEGNLRVGSLKAIDSSIDELYDTVGNVGGDLTDLTGRVGTLETNTAGITNDKGVTVIDQGLKVKGEDGREVFSVARDGAINAVVTDGLGGTNANFVLNGETIELKYGNNGITANINGTTISGNGTDVVVNENGATFTNANGTTVINGGAITADKLKLGTIEDVEAAIKGLDEGVGNVGATVAGIERVGEGAPGEATTIIEGATSFDGNGMTTGTINAANGSFMVEEGSGKTVVAGSLVYSENQNGSYGMLNGNQLTLQGADGSKVSIINGNIETSGRVTANNFYTDKYDLNSIGEQLDNLETTIDDTNENVAGIERKEVETTDGTGYATVIENGTVIGSDGSFSTAFGKLTIEKDGRFSLSSDAWFGGDVNYKYVNKDGSISFGSLQDLTDRVSELEDKTQNINGDNTYGPGETPEGGTDPVQPGGNTDYEGNLNADSITTGKVTVGDKTQIGDGNISVGEDGNKTTIDNGNITVDNGEEGKVVIGDGDVSVIDKDGNEVGSIMGNAQDIDRLEEGMASMSNRISKVEDRIDKVGAMSAAIANLRTMGYDPTAPTEIAVGVGQYRSETGVALGMFHYPNKDFMLSLSVSTSGDEVMGGIGATWKFGRKTPAEMLQAEQEKAAKAKVAKALAMKKAAEEAKVAAQQAKHAKMAAEKAAK